MMHRKHRAGRINWKLVIIIAGVVVVLSVGAVVARYVRKQVLAERGLTKGQAAYEKKDWPAAVDNLYEYLVRYPNDPPVLKQYAEANLRVRPLEGKHLFTAINEYRRIMRLEPDDESVYKPLAALYEATGQVSELAYIAAKRLETAPDDPEARLWRARALLAQDKPEMIEEARSLLDNDSADSPGLLQILEAKNEYGRRYVETCQLLADLTMKHHPGTPAAKAREDALAWLDRAVEHAPDSARPYVSRAMFLRNTPPDPENRLAETNEQRIERLRAAKADLEKASERNPSSPGVLTALAREWLLHAEPDPDRAEAALDALDKVDEKQLLADYEMVDPLALTLAKFTLRATLLRFGGKSAEGADLALKTLRKVANKDLLAYKVRRNHVLAVAIELLARSGTADGGEYTGTYTPADGETAEATGKVVRADDGQWRAVLTAGTGEDAVEVTLTGKAEDDTVSLTGEADDVKWQGTFTTGQTLKAQSEKGRFGLSYNCRLARACLEEYLELGKTLPTPTTREQKAHFQALVARAEGSFQKVINALEPLQTEGAASPEDRLLLAEAYVRTGQSRLAAKALRAAPQTPAVAKQVAREAMRLGYWAEALGAAEQAEKLAADDLETTLIRIEATIHLAGQRVADPDRVEALAKQLATLLKQNPKNTQIRTLQAIVQANQGKADAATKTLEQVIKDSPQAETLPAELAVIQLHIRQKHLDKAVEFCNRACERHADRAAPWEALAIVLVANDKYAEAVKRLKKAAKDFKEVAEAFKKAAAERLKNKDAASITVIKGDGPVPGRPDGAKESAIDDELRSLRRAIATLQIAHGGLDGRKAGIERLKKLAAEDPDDVRTRSLLLDLPETRGDRELAGNLIEEIRKVQGEGGLQWQFHQARLWVARRQWNKADEIKRYLNRCMDVDPRWDAPALLLGAMYEALDKPEQAETVYKSVLSANLAAARVADRLIALLGRQDRTAEARQVLSQVAGASPGLSAVYGWRLAAGAGDTAQAIAELKHRAQANPDDAAAHLSLARLTYIQTKDLDLASSYLDDVEEAAPAALAPTILRVAMLRDAGRPEADIQKVIDAKVQQIKQGVDAGQDPFGKADLFAAYLLRADYLADQGKTKLAEKDYQRLPSLGLDGRGCQRLARFYSNNTRWDEAITTLEDGVKAYPENDILKDRLARALLGRGGEGDREQADEILADLEGHAGATGLRALLLLREGKEEEARPLLEQVVETSPTMVDAHLALVGLAMNRGEPREARLLAAKAIDMNPNHLGLMLAKANAERAMRDLPAAVQTIDDAVRRFPNNPAALAALVSVADQTKDAQALQRARTLADAAIEVNPSDDRLRLVKADAVSAAGQRQKAIDELEVYRKQQAQDGKPSLPVVLALAEMYRAADDLALCRKRIDEAADLAARDHPAVIRQQILADAAAKDYDAVVKTVSPPDSKIEDPGILFIAAQALHASESDTYRKDAKQCYEKALTAAPRFIEAKLGLALLSYQTGDADRATRLYREVLKAQPKNAQALNDLAWILQENKQAYEEALDLANRGVAVAPENGNLRDTRGVILQKLGRLQEARQDFEKLVNLRKDDPEAHAKALERLKEVRKQLDGIAAGGKRQD